MGRARTTNLLYFLKCNNLVFLKTQRAAHSLFPEKVLVLEAAAPCRTAGPLARGAGGRGMRGPSRKCQVGESQFLANYLGNLQFRFLSVTTRCAAPPLALLGRAARTEPRDGARSPVATRSQPLDFPLLCSRLWSQTQSYCYALDGKKLLLLLFFCVSKW